MSCLAPKQHSDGRCSPATLCLVCEVVGKGVQAEEADEGVQLGDAVLQRCASEAPSVPRSQCEGSLCSVATAVL